jgi:hypothetical protein
MESTSLMSRTTKLLMLKVVKIKKVKPSGSGENTMERIKDGLSYTLEERKIRRKLEWTVALV